MTFWPPTIKTFLFKFIAVAAPLAILITFLPVVPPLEKEALLSQLSQSITNQEIAIKASYGELGVRYSKVVSTPEFVEMLRSSVLIKSGDRIAHSEGQADVEWDAGNCNIEMTVYSDLGKTGLYFSLSSRGGLRGDVRLHLLDAGPMRRLLNGDKKSTY